MGGAGAGQSAVWAGAGRPTTPPRVGGQHAPVAAQQAHERLGDDAHLCLGRQVEVELRHRHDHSGAAALQQRLRVAQQQPVVGVHDVGLAGRQRCGGRLLRTRAFGLILFGAVEGFLGVLLQQRFLGGDGEVGGGGGRLLPAALLPTLLGPGLTHVLGGAQELRARVAGEHADDDHLAPLLHVDEQVAEFPVVLVNQVDALRAHLLKGHHHAARHQLGNGQWQERVNKKGRGPPSRSFPPPIRACPCTHRGLVGQKLLNDLDQLVLLVRIQTEGETVERDLSLPPSPVFPMSAQTVLTSPTPTLLVEV